MTQEVFAVAVESLTVQLGRRQILKELDLAVKKGEFLTLLGNSGSGKSTLLRSIAGFIQPAAGRIFKNGAEITRLAAHQRRIGYVHQSYALFPHLNVFENVAFGLREQKQKKRMIQEKVEWALSLVQLQHAKFLYPGELSGGMQQRIALARALVLHPDVLLLDEPLSALDANLRQELRQEIKSLHAQFPEMTIIYVTHDREEALTLSHRIALLQAGAIVQLGRPDELYDAPVNEFAARYLGTVNEVPAEKLWPTSLREAQAGIAWFVRPEAVQLHGEGPITLTGTVAGAEWAGHYYRLQIDLHAASSAPFVVDVPRKEKVPGAGADVTISFRPEDCMRVEKNA